MTLPNNTAKKGFFWMMLMVGLGLSLPRILYMVWRLGELMAEASGDCYRYVMLG